MIFVQSLFLILILASIVFFLSKNKNFVPLGIIIFSAPFIPPYVFILSLLLYLVSLVLKYPYVKLSKQNKALLALVLVVLTINLYTSVLNRYLVEAATLLIALGYFIFLNSQKIELDEIRVIFKGYFLGSIAISIYYFVINTQPITSHVTLPVGISGTINYTSFYLYIGYIIYPILFVRNRAQRILIFAIGIATVYLFKTRSVLFISLFSIVAPYVQFTIRRFITGTFGIGLAIYIVLRLNILNPDDPNDIFYSLVNWNRNFSNMERLYLIITGIEHAKDSIIGYGFGGIEKLLAQDTLIRGKHPHFHNTLLNMILSFGWIGTALYYLIFVSTFLKLLFSPKSLSPLFFKVFITFLAAVFIYSMIESILFNASLFFLIIIPIGVINSLVLNKKK